MKILGQDGVGVLVIVGVMDGGVWLLRGLAWQSHRWCIASVGDVMVGVSVMVGVRYGWSAGGNCRMLTAKALMARVARNCSTIPSR